MDKSRSGKLPDMNESPRTPTSPGPRDQLSDLDDDSFFDDPLPDNSKSKEFSG